MWLTNCYEQFYAVFINCQEIFLTFYLFPRENSFEAIVLYLGNLLFYLENFKNVSSWEFYYHTNVLFEYRKWIEKWMNGRKWMTRRIINLKCDKKFAYRQSLFKHTKNCGTSVMKFLLEKAHCLDLLERLSKQSFP